MPRDEEYMCTPPTHVQELFSKTGGSGERLYPFTQKIFDSSVEEGEMAEEYQILWNRANSSGIGAPWPADDLEFLLELIDKACVRIDEHLKKLWLTLKHLEVENGRPMETFAEYKMFLFVEGHLSVDKEKLQKEIRPEIERVYLNLCALNGGA